MFVVLRIGPFIIVFLILLWSTSASYASSCADVTPGAQEGPNVPAGEYNNAFTLPYDNACFVLWPSDGRGAAGREEDRQKCYGLSDVDILEYDPDGGSNHNMCVFRLRNTQANPPDEPAPPSIDDSPTPSVTPIPAPPPDAPAPAPDLPPNSERSQDTSLDVTQPYYTIKLCNSSNDDDMYAAAAVFDDPTDKGVTVRGWWKIPLGECRNIISRNFGDWDSMYFFLHAETHHWEWPSRKSADRQFCLSSVKYARYNSGPYNCAENERLYFFSRDVVNRDKEKIETIYKVAYH